MSTQESQIRIIILYHFRLNHDTPFTTQSIQSVFGVSSVSQRTVQRWFNRFRNGDFSLQDCPRIGRPSQLNQVDLMALVRSEPTLSSRALAAQFNCSHHTIIRVLQSQGMEQRIGRWIPHVLTPEIRTARCDAAMALLSKSRRTSWLDRLVTGDEKWVLYVNHCRIHQWVSQGETPQPEPRRDPHGMKVLLSIWWNIHGIVHFELLPSNTFITSSLYCSQLERVYSKLLLNYPQNTSFFYLHDNARPHISKLTREKILKLGWEVLPHAPYSPDMAPTDYYLFRALQAHLKHKSFINIEQIQNEIQFYFSSLPSTFFRDGIYSLVERWHAILRLNGEYLE